MYPNLPSFCCRYLKGVLRTRGGGGRQTQGTEKMGLGHMWHFSTNFYPFLGIFVQLLEKASNDPSKIKVPISQQHTNFVVESFQYALAKYGTNIQVDYVVMSHSMNIKNRMLTILTRNSTNQIQARNNIEPFLIVVFLEI